MNSFYRVQQRLLVLSGIVLALLAPPLAAHPHYWVDVTLDVELDAQGRLIAIQQEWHFDEFVSAILLDEMDTIVPGRPPLSVLASESKRIVNDLAPFHYYSNFTAGGKALPVLDPVSHFLKVVETAPGPLSQPKPATNLLVLVMRFEWPQPLEVGSEGFDISVFDPTYYASFNHNSVDQVAVSAPASLSCKKNLALPNPDDSMIAYAFSLDQNQRDTQGLGQHFAEVVSIQCQQQGAQ